MAEEHQRRRVLFVVDYERDGYSVFKFNLKDLFSDNHTSPPPPPMKMEMLPLPGPPVASFHEPEFFRGNIAFAVSGTTIVGLGLKRTFTYDMKAQAAGSGPGTAAFKTDAVLIPVGADDVYALTIFPHWGHRPHLEALSPGKGLTLAWRALPQPPPELQISSNPDINMVCRMTTCFTMGGRLWLSAQGLGTYSLETAGPRRTWRKEGSWELPVEGLPAVYVPELGRLFGFCPRRRCLCACDMDVRPPVVKEVWEDTWPEECIKIGYMVAPHGSLVYLGGGRLCITRLVNDKVASSALCVQAVQLQLRQRHRVEMVMRRIRCYTMSKFARRAYALQPSTS
uniref:Uncharacterized protein n=1 Tax=Avena sativa TaxID=4498 RepID=A0ACD5XPV8_AVESA